MKHNKNNLPEEALYIIRYHSLYPYHQNDEYKHFMNDKDIKMFRWLKLFNKYDLYTKTNHIIKENTMTYKNLIKKYFNGLI